ncbi:MAG: translation initiation factor IF-2 N-terminal domain-containing protein, partial [Thermosynechococcaceae cyanobacterium]
MSTDKVRIYKLAQELSLENKDVLDACKQLDIAVKSHSSTITEDEAAKIRKTVSSAEPKRPASPPRRTAAAATPKKPNAPPKPVKKPHKQQILEVRKRTEQPELVSSSAASTNSAEASVEASP